MCAADISELFALSDKGGSRLGGVGVETERNGETEEGKREGERERETWSAQLPETSPQRQQRRRQQQQQQQSARWSCPARLQTGSGRGVAAELNYYKLPRHSYRMHAPARARKSSPLRQPLTLPPTARLLPPAACPTADVIILGLSAN